MKTFINYIISKIIYRKFKTTRDPLSFKNRVFICPSKDGFLVLQYFKGILVPVKLFKFQQDSEKAYVFAEELQELLSEKLNY